MIILFIMMTLSVGVFFGLIFTSEMCGIKRGIATFIIALIVGAILTGFFELEYQDNVSKWNNGYCNCGGQWELVNVDHVKNDSTHYYYQCDKCKELINTVYNFQEKYIDK